VIRPHSLSQIGGSFDFSDVDLEEDAPSFAEVFPGGGRWMCGVSGLAIMGKM
jgi:hypothetical protein